MSASLEQQYCWQAGLIVSLCDWSLQRNESGCTSPKDDSVIIFFTAG